MAFGIDYSSGTADPKVLKANGVKFVCRYVSTFGNPKNLTPKEAIGLKEASIAVVVVFETTANRALKGRAAGAADAKSAQAQTIAVGLGDVPVYFAVDFDATPGDSLAVNNYLAGAASVLGADKTGVYGGYWSVKRALDAKVCKYAWQTYAWSGGQWDPRANIRQYKNGQSFCGVSVDFDRSTTRDFGQTPKSAPVVTRAQRRARLRAWVRAQRAEGATWTALKKTTKWKLWRRLGGK